MVTDLAGQRIGPYQLHRLIGRGGMAWVYRATHTVMNWDVALKILDPSLTGDADFVERFTREARTLDQLQHPNIVRVRDAAVLDQCCYIAMEYLDGESLDTTLERVKRLSPPQALAIGLQAVEALSYAHTQFRLIHRDVKPGNIFLLRDGSVKMLDFGVATMLGTQTIARTRIGTPEYMPYEQYQGQADERSDIYGLGATLYEAVTGRVPPPFAMESPIPPRELNSQISPALEQALVCALQRDPARRFQTVAEMGRALHAAWTSPGLVSPIKLPGPPRANTPPHKSDTPGQVAHKGRKPNRALLLGGGGIAVLVLMLLMASSFSGGGKPLVPTRTPASPATTTLRALSSTATITPPSLDPTAYQVLTAVEPGVGELLAPDSPAPVFKWVMSPLEAGQRYVVMLDDRRSESFDFVRTVDDVYQYDGAQQWPEPLTPGSHTWQVVIVARSDQGGDDVLRGPTWTFTVSAPATSTRASTLTPTLARSVPTQAPQKVATATVEAPLPATPTCPTGKFWDPVMNRCQGGGSDGPSATDQPPPPPPP